MEREEIIINLKLIESVQKMQKLTTRDVYLNIEFPSLIPECVRRWKRQDGRDATIRKINEIVNCAIELSKQGDVAIKDYLMKSCVGISNLKETYLVCNQTCARLDMILDKIHSIEIITNEKVSNLTNEKVTNLTNEKVNLTNEKVTNLINEKINLTNEKVNLTNEKVNLTNEKGTNLTNEKVTNLINEKITNKK